MIFSIFFAFVSCIQINGKSEMDEQHKKNEKNRLRQCYGTQSMKQNFNESRNMFFFCFCFAFLHSFSFPLIVVEKIKFPSTNDASCWFTQTPPHQLQIERTRQTESNREEKQSQYM